MDLFRPVAGQLYFTLLVHSQVTLYTTEVQKHQSIPAVLSLSSVSSVPATNKCLKLNILGVSYKETGLCVSKIGVCQDSIMQ
jgi:hypothetical protein